MTSLRARLTVAVMMPLVALALTFGGITCWMIHRTISTTADRTLVAAATTLGRALDAGGRLRGEILPLAVQLLQSRSTPQPIFSIRQGDRLLAGSARLLPPPDYHPAPAAPPARHDPASFPGRSGEQPVAPGAGGDGEVIRPAYLRDGTVAGRSVRIATEVRRPRGSAGPIVVQVADFLDDREAFAQTYYLRVAGAGILIVMIALLLFYGAITWGLGPFASLTAQIDDARRDSRGNVRVALAPGDPLEARLLAHAFNELMARTERATRSLRQFTANASHQLRTPLTIVRVHADVLSRYGPATPQGATALADIVAAVAALDHLLTQLIALARTDEQPRLLDALEPFDLTAVAAASLAGRVTCADAAAMDVGLEAPPDPVIALGNASFASEMIANLLDNAIRYNRAGGSVTVRVLVREGEPVIEIEDDGPGITAADRERVWDRFYRVAGAQTPPGSGLGLAIVRALGERMGARASLEDAAGAQGLKAVIVFRAGSIETFRQAEQNLQVPHDMTAS